MNFNRIRYKLVIVANIATQKGYVLILRKEKSLKPNERISLICYPFWENFNEKHTGEK
jgi:hypothetical protein